jgi:hypothetical protein
MRIAAGEHVVFDEPSRPADVGFFFRLHPDVHAKRIVAVDGLESVAEISGVERVVPGLRAGDDCTWRSGSPGFVAAVFGSAPDHATVNEIRAEFYRRVVVTTES